jgi:hypothetical protein
LFTAFLVFDEIQAISRGGKELKASFDTTLDRLKENINNITGADAFPYIVPQPPISGKIPLAIWNAGDYPLTGVTVTIMDRSAFRNGTGEFDAPYIDVGVLPPRGHKVLNKFIEPKPDATGEDVYTIDILAQNGFVSEMLKFRKGKNNIPWAYMFTANKQSNHFGPQTPSKIPNTDFQGISTGVWSDDPDFGRAASLRPASAGK